MKQREIKFRVWDNVDYMSESFTLQDLVMGKIKFTPECKVMQFTGLKDKNGVQIYEGDIVKCPVTLNQHIYGDFQNRVVKWKEDSFTWVFDSPFSWGRFEGNVTGDGDYIKYTDEGVKILIEVIGNIHEHQHLLK